MTVTAGAHIARAPSRACAEAVCASAHLSHVRGHLGKPQVQACGASNSDAQGMSLW